MTKISPTLAFVAVIFGFAAGVSAQNTPPLRLPAWEISGSIGVFMMDSDRITEEEHTAGTDRFTGDDWLAVAYGLGVGHYWTPHLKVDAGFAHRSLHDTIDFESGRPPGLSTAFKPILVVTGKTVDLTTVVAGATYQFRENAFFHPYVSAGVRMGWLREHRFRDQSDGTTPYPHTVMALDERTNQLLARPVVAGGAKWYLDQFVFLRPEAALALRPGRLLDMTFGVSVGRDF